MRIARPAAAPIAATGLRHRAFEAFCLALIAFCCVLLAWTQARGDDLLSLDAGALVVSATSEFESWPALALLDGNGFTGWASRRGDAAPNAIVIELPRLFALESIVFDNTRTQETDFPGISARYVQVWLSTTSSVEGYSLATTVEASQGGREQFPLPPGSEARWIRLVVQSNWGNDQFTEMMELEAYGSPQGPEEVVPPVAGVYLTNFGPLYLEQAGDLVRGCYEAGTASLNGYMEGRLMRVHWYEKSGSGQALLALSLAGDYLNGLWYQDSELRGAWQGHRDTGDPQPPCEISSVLWSSE